MAISDFYNKSVTVKRLTHTDDDYGGTTNTWSTNLSNYSCRIYAPKGESEITNAGEIEGVLYSGAGGNSDVKKGDKIVDGTDEYMVKNVDKVRNKNSIHHLEFLLDKIK